MVMVTARAGALALMAGAFIGGVILNGLTKPASAITLSIGGIAVPGQGQFSSIPGVTTIDFESGAPTSGSVVYSTPSSSLALVSFN